METPTTLTDALQRISDRFWRVTIDILPQLLAAIALVLVGLLIAKLCGSIVRRLCRSMKFDEAAERVGITSLARKIGYEREPSRLVARLVGLFILLLFLSAAIDIVGLSGLEATIGALTAYLPRVVIAIVIVLVGALLASFVSRTVQVATRENGIDYGPAVAKLCVVVILTAAGLSAISQLGIDIVVLRTSAIIVVAGATFCLALMVALGCREITQNIVTGFYAKKLFRPGDEVEVLGHRGRVVAITPIQTIIENADGEVIMANRVYLRAAIRRGSRDNRSS